MEKPLCEICGESIIRGKTQALSEYLVAKYCAGSGAGWSDCRKEAMWRETQSTVKLKPCEVCGETIELVKGERPSRYYAQLTCRVGDCAKKLTKKQRGELSPRRKNRDKSEERKVEALSTSWYDNHPPMPEEVRAAMENEQTEVRRVDNNKWWSKLNLQPLRVLTPAEIAAIAHEITPMEKISDGHDFMFVP
jgi:ribosomal protein S30